jgi:nucleotide-binding universal stress UspA family protein
MTAKPVVAATDCSREALRAVEWAAREAMLRSAPLRILSAASLPKMVLLQLRPERDAALRFVRHAVTGPWPRRRPGPPRRLLAR